MNKLVPTVIFSAYALIVCAVPAYSAPVNDPNTPPDYGCVITHKWEDGSRIAECVDGMTWHYDPDGLGPYCPRTSKRFGESGWHTAKATSHAQKSCGREVRRDTR